MYFYFALCKRNEKSYLISLNATLKLGLGLHCKQSVMGIQNWITGKSPVLLLSCN